MKMIKEQRLGVESNFKYSKSMFGSGTRSGQSSQQKDFEFMIEGIDRDFGNISCTDDFDQYNKFYDNPLVAEASIKIPKPISPIYENRIVYLEHWKNKIKEPRITKAEKRREKFAGKEATEGGFQKRKSPYSVYEDMIILTIFDENKDDEHKSMNDKIDLVMEELPGRSFESLRERYRKWLKDFDDAECGRIKTYCDENYETCDNFMIKKKQDALSKRQTVEAFVAIPKKTKTLDEIEDAVTGPKASSIQDEEAKPIEEEVSAVAEPETEIQAEIVSIPQRDEDMIEALIESSKKKEREDYLGKRNRQDADEADKALRRRGEEWKRGGGSVKERGEMLYRMLKFIACYHEKHVQDIVADIDDDSALDISKLRLVLCNDTVTKRIYSSSS